MKKKNAILIYCYWIYFVFTSICFILLLLYYEVPMFDFIISNEIFIVPLSISFHIILILIFISIIVFYSLREV